MTAVLERTEDKARAPAKKTAEDERRCLASGILKSREEMIRFVIGPDADVVPDLAENLPGHGLWVTATVESIELAVKKNLFAKAAKEQAKPAADLAEIVTRLLRKRCLDFLGLSKSAGIAVLGEAQTEAALRAGKIDLYIHAPDATRVLDNRHEKQNCDLFSREELGSALGYAQIVYAGILQNKLTNKLKREINRLRTMTLTPERTE